MPLKHDATNSTVARKRKASSMLQEFASQLGVPKARGGSDLSIPAFTALHGEVKAKCSTPEQRAKADELLALFQGNARATTAQSQPALPTLPTLPPLPLAGAAVARSSTALPKDFRLRGTSCQFTYNSMTFAQMGASALWSSFIAFLGTLAFVSRWSAAKQHGRGRGKFAGWSRRQQREREHKVAY